MGNWELKRLSGFGEKNESGHVGDYVRDPLLWLTYPFLKVILPEKEEKRLEILK